MITLICGTILRLKDKINEDTLTGMVMIGLCEIILTGIFVGAIIDKLGA